MSVPLPTLQLGHTLQGRYRIQRKLGSGGFGSVYLAVDSRLWDRKVALKELSDPSPAAQRLFRQEAAVLAVLNHPGLVRVSDFFEEGRSHYLVMDYVEGRDLLDVAIEAEQASRLLPVAQVGAWMAQVCEAVAYLHRQTPPIIHRDIKPNNIRLNASGRAILVDFGIAKIDPRARTEVMAKATSEGYSPPEQYAGAARTGTRSDVYALGATLYALLTVTPPPDSFQRLTRGVTLPPPRAINPAVSAALEAVVLKAMALNALDRYADGGALLAALSPALARGAEAAPVWEVSGRASSGQVSPVPQAQPEAGTALRCPECGLEVRTGAHFCAHCGLSLPLAQRCPHCGMQNRPGARYCAHCQARLA